MKFNDVVNGIGEQKYVKEFVLGDKKIIFYYNNKSTSEGGGVFVYLVDSNVERPDKQEDLKSFISSGKTTAFGGIPNYTMNLHKVLFDTKNKLF